MTSVSGGKEAARGAHDSAWVDRMAQAGLVAFGVVHLVLAWLAINLAFGNREGKADTTGAVQELAGQPMGGVLVWAVAVGMFFLVVWQGLEACFGHRGEDDGKRTLKRLASAGKAVVYAVIGVSAVRIAAGSSSSGGTDSTTAKLMDLPAGQVLVGLVGIAIIGVGVGLIVVAYRESYLKNFESEGTTGSAGRLYRWAGRAGHGAKGVALGVVGGLFLWAAIDHQAKKSGGLDVALRTILDQPFGPALLTLIGVGVACYGVFCFAQARHLDR